MRTRTTIILLVLTIGVLFYIRFYESKAPGTRVAQEMSNHVFSVPPESVDGFTITNQEAKIELRKRDNRWYLDSPVKDLADETVVEQLFSAINDTPVDSKIDDARSSLKEFGLIKPNARLKILGREAPPELLLGKDGAVENKMYARLENSNTVFVIGNELKNQMQRKADDFRDHRIIATDAAVIDKVTIKSQAGEIHLEKEQGHWQIEKPLKARGDDSKVADLIAQTFSGRIQSFADAKETVAASGLAEPKGSITFSAPGMEKPATLEIGQRLPGNQVIYARISTRDVVFLAPEKVEEILETRPDDIRDRKLMRINFDMVDRINLEPAGKPKIVLARNGEEWTIKSSGDKPANAEQVRQMADGLQTQPVTSFVSNVASELAKYGLDQPSMRVTFSSYASENTAETKAGEQPFATLSFGRADGNTVYARVEEEPFIVSTPGSTLRGIPSDPIEWQDLSVLKLKPEDILSMEVQREGSPPAPVSREKTGWKSGAGQTVNVAAAESIATMISSLRAVRWIGPVEVTQGFIQPRVTVSFTLKDQKPQKLIVGRETPNGMSFATIEGSGATFEMNRPDTDVLLAPLVSAAPAASASPGMRSPDAENPSAPVAAPVAK